MAVTAVFERGFRHRRKFAGVQGRQSGTPVRSLSARRPGSTAPTAEKAQRHVLGRLSEPAEVLADHFGIDGHDLLIAEPAGQGGMEPPVQLGSKL